MESKFYSYSAKKHLTQELNNINLTTLNNVYLFSYDVITSGKYPFLRVLLTNNFMKKLTFPKIPIFSNMSSTELINTSKVSLCSLLLFEEFKKFNENVVFDGFLIFENNLYLFFDLTECDEVQINENILRFTLIHEIFNQKQSMNNSIELFIDDLFQSNNGDLCFLTDENDASYEIPSVGFVCKPENKINFTLIFGEIKGTKNDLLGPFYYFTNYSTCLNLLKNQKNNNLTKYGIVRFAIFIGRMMYFENNSDDCKDESEIKKQRLLDLTLDQNMEQLTIKLTDHDGIWSTIGYDSAYLGCFKFENNKVFDKQLLAIKEFNQQIPLSCHY
jgi:hypothetical protein